MNKENEDNWEALLKIDRDDLDSAIIQQPDIFYRVSEAYVTARDSVEVAEENLGRVDAELDLEFRTSAEKKNEKTTETRIKSQIIIDPRHIGAAELYREAKLATEKLGAMREAFSQRSMMLKELTNLYVAGYFTTSSARGSAKQQAEAAANAGRTAMANERRQPFKRKE